MGCSASMASRYCISHAGCNIKSSEPDYFQLLLPRVEVNEAICHCHAGMVSGHFAIAKTLDQVKRRFYWFIWKENTKCFCSVEDAKNV